MRRSSQGETTIPEYSSDIAQGIPPYIPLYPLPFFFFLFHFVRGEGFWIFHVTHLTRDLIAKDKKNLAD